jgi:hypothetical protein
MTGTRDALGVIPPAGFAHEPTAYSLRAHRAEHGLAIAARA